LYYQSKAPEIFQWSLHIDIQEDFRTRVYGDLKRAGYSDIDKDHVVYQYYNLRKRQIEAKPRKVVYSKEFSYPPEYRVALKEFEDRVLKGQNLLPFQSEKIKEAAYSDMLLNDWGIQHFHLSRRFRDDGFVARSKYQIFAYVTDETVYMIQIYPHNAEDLYSRRELVRILRDNWPELIERFHLEGVTELVEKYDDHQYGQIRDAHISTFVELGKNEVYGMIGGGYMSNGYSTEALRNADFWMNRLAVFQKIVKDNASWIGKTINEYIGVAASYCNMIVQLLWIDNADKVTMVETASGLIVQIDTQENWIRICKSNEVFG
jgi:hypothetical protein